LRLPSLFILFPYRRSSDLSFAIRALLPYTTQRRTVTGIVLLLVGQVLLVSQLSLSLGLIFIFAGVVLLPFSSIEWTDTRLTRGQDRKSTRLNSSHVKISYA